MVIEPPIFALGLGLGLVMPTMTIAVQNALPLAHRGVGTATLAFFRSLGGLIGVTGSGAILAYRVQQAGGPSGGFDMSSLTGGRPRAARHHIAGGPCSGDRALPPRHRHDLRDRNASSWRWRWSHCCSCRNCR